MKWTDDLSVGVELIDSEHKSLINAINELFDACGKGLGRKKISETLEFMQNYIRTHFSDEEKLQKKCGYPDYSNHCRYHASFIEKVGNYSKRLEEEGANIALVADFNSFVTDWLINHISREDKKIGLYIKQNS
ncbi:MAG TPA: bacteriohemerythrin [Ruminiclostridium sp.]|nr:bacteriohemerythrin [Ruminiclostridium sp.]